LKIFQNGGTIQDGGFFVFLLEGDINPQNKKTVQFLVLFLPNIFIKIEEIEKIPLIVKNYLYKKDADTSTALWLTDVFSTYNAQT
jgi:hypothetical protein